MRILKTNHFNLTDEQEPCDRRVSCQGKDYF